MANRDENDVKNTEQEQGSTEASINNNEPQAGITEVKLTPKQRSFADYILSHPKEPITNAAKQAYDTEDYGTQRAIASENLTKPNIMAYLSIHADRALTDMIEIAEYSKRLGKTGDKAGAAYAGVAVAINRDILDRVHGKATQRTEVISKKVSVVIDLTGGAQQG